MSKKRKRRSKKWKRHSKKIIKPMKKEGVFFAKTNHQQFTNSSEFGLCDDVLPAENPAYIDESDRTKWIAIVENNENKTVTFTPIDNCLEYDFRKKDGKPDKRCDGVLTVMSLIIFVELKQRKGRRSKDWIEDGELQLKQTIFHFSKTTDSKSFKNKLAYIANNKRPIFTRGQEVRTNRFYKETGYILRIQNRISID